MFADFKLTEERLEESREATADGGKALPWFENDVVAADGTVVARVRKQLYVREKQRDGQREPGMTDSAAATGQQAED